jgi:hypothetical protein
METRDLIKYAALAGAAYLVYTWWRDYSAAAAHPATGALPPGTSPTTGTTVTSAGKPTTEVGAAVANDPNVRLAIDEGYATASWPGPLYSVDQWNWFRSQGGKPIYDAAVLIDDRSRAIAALEYHQRMAEAARQGATTLSGLGMAGLGFSIWQARMPGDYAWLM